MKNKIFELENKIKKAQDAYYNGSEIMSDDEYDALIYELGLLNPKSKLLAQVGADPTEEWKKEKHLTPLGSLNKVNYPHEMEKWISEALDNKKVLVVEKLDGLSIGLQFENSKIIKACLRGNGYEGENILTNVLKMKGLISTLKQSFSGTVRGEIVLLKSDHQKHFPNYSNPRNASSGICRKLDGIGVEHLTLMMYDVMGDVDFFSEEDKFSFLKKNGFIIPNYQLCSSSKQVNVLWQQYQDKIRDTLDYEIDGLVVSCNDMAIQQSLGETNLRSKGKMAFKFANQFIKTTANNITWSVGNSGRIVPICWFDKVNLLGSDIEKASVYNVAYINQLQLDIGAEILVCKANEIIPRVEKVIKPTGTTAIPPSKCPECNHSIKKEGEYLVCPNRETCPAQIVGRIKNWVSELNILELGDTLIEKLVDKELVFYVSDLYTLTVDQLADLDRMGEKSAKNVYNSLWSHNPVPLELFLGGLSIPMIGSSTIKLIMEAGHDNLDAILKLSQSDIENIKGIGPIKAQSLYQGLKDNKDIIQALQDNGLKIKDKIIGKLTGKTLCFTGTMTNKRAVLEQMVVDSGGTVKSSVGKGLSYLVINDVNSTSSKAVAARKLGTVLVSEDDFLQMIK